MKKFNIKVKDVAEFLAIAPSTAYEIVKKLPREYLLPIKLSSVTIYRCREDIFEYLKENN